MTTLRIRRTLPGAIIPRYQTPGASGLDMHACVSAPIHMWVGERRVIPTGIAVEIPTGHEGQVRGRSGKTLAGLTVHLGTIDSDYRGDVGIIVEAAYPFIIEPGDRIAQLVIVPVVRCEVVEVDELGETSRGPH